MTSTIINFIFNKFLAKFVEIDTSKTNISLFSGSINLENVKVNREVFNYFYIPYLELLYGYVGKMNIELKMPFFYNNPIIVNIDKIFIHTRQKDINKLNKEVELSTILEYKKNLLLNLEQLFAEIEKIKRQKNTDKILKIGEKTEQSLPEIAQKIINNLIIDINNIVIRFDDNLSYKNIPFSIGVILKQIIVRRTKSDYKILDDPNEIIPLMDVNYKAAKIEELSVFMDCFKSEKELNNEIMIAENYIKLKPEFRNFLKDEAIFYIYCMYELEELSKKFEFHQYLLYRLTIKSHLAINTNTKNKQPLFKMNIDIYHIILNVTFKQMRTILKLLAYINLNSYYQNGIASQYFKGKLSLSDKRNYVDGYAIYFRDKYINKTITDYPTSLKNMEKYIHYKEIRKMRSYAMRKLEYMHKIEEIENKIKKEEEQLLPSNVKKMKILKYEKEKIIKMEEQDFMNTIFTDKILNELRPLEFENLEENYVTIQLNFNLLMTSLNLFETDQGKINRKWSFKNKVLEFSLHRLNMELVFRKVDKTFLFTLENMIVTDKNIRNPNYNKIIFGDLTKEGKIISMILEINPKFKKSNLYVKLITEKPLYLILNDYTFQYIIAQSVDIFTTTILLEEYSLYANDSILKYIKEGYENKYLPTNFSHSNISLDINLICPVIIIPIDVFDDNRNQCLLLNLGELTIKSILPPRVELNPHINYKKTKDENLIYDIYRINLRKTRISTIDNCTERNNFRGKEGEILKNVDFNMDIKVILQSENPNFDNTIVNIFVNEMLFEINEFQILLIIEFIGNYLKNGYKVELNLNNYETKGKQIDLIPYEEVKKKADIMYNNFIKSFASSKYHRVSNQIKDIHNNKKKVLVNIVLKKAQFSLKKNYLNNTESVYLFFSMNFLQIECDIAEDASMVVIIIVKNIELFDFNTDDKNEKVINECFQRLITSAGENENDGVIINQTKDDKNIKSANFIDYQLLRTGDELNNIVHVNDLNITVSLESLLHMYQFAMYYTEIYLNKSSEAIYYYKEELEKMENSINENKMEVTGGNNINKNADKYLSNIIKESSINKIKLKLKNKSNVLGNMDEFNDYLRNKYNEKILFERRRQIMTVLVKVNNTKIKMPFDPKKTSEPLIYMHFNLVYNQNTTIIFTHFFTQVSKRIIGIFYETFANSMNTLVSNFDLDIVYYLQDQLKFTGNKPEERLITNFRMFCLIENFLVLKSKQNVMIIDVTLEPLLVAFGMLQIRNVYNLYLKIFKYIRLLFEKYIPYAKPGDKNIKNKMRLTLKELVKTIIKKQKKSIRSSAILFNNNNKTNKINTILINTKYFNSLLITNVKSSKIRVIFFDNTIVSLKNILQNILLDVQLKKFTCTFLQNSKITDKGNVSNMLYEILTGDELPIKKYNKNTLSMYYYIFGSVHANYHNIISNKFEPLVEPFEANIEMMRVAPFFRAKTDVIINDIINYNLSVDSFIAIKSFITKFIEDQNKLEINEHLSPSGMRSTQNNLEGKIKGKKKLKEGSTRIYDIVLQFSNNCGVDLDVFFESNPSNPKKIKADDILTFTSDTLYEARGLNKYNLRMDRANFGVYLYDSYPIKDVSYKKPSRKQYKINVELESKIIPLYFNIKVEPSYLVNNVIFSSAIAFNNQTNFEVIKILIGNTKLNKNFIKVFKGSKEYIPLTWLISQPPESSIFISFEEEVETYKICDHINQLFHEPKNTNEIKENIEEDLKKKFKGNDNPKFNEIIEIEKYERKNMKNSMFIKINSVHENYFLNFDYFLIQSKNVKSTVESTNKRRNELNKQNQNKSERLDDETLYSQKENNDNDELLIPEINYEYIITVRYSLIIMNKMPLTLFFKYNDKEINLQPLKKTDLKDFSADKVDNYFFIKIKYFGTFYSSDKIYLINKEIHQYIELKNETDKTVLQCHMIKRPEKKVIDKQKNYFVETKGYSINTYEIIFFFDYILNNRLTHELWICPCKDIKKMSQEEIKKKSKKMFPTSLNLLSFPEYEYKISIRDENSDWSESFNINTIGIQSSIKLKHQFNSIKSYNLINEIAIIFSSSELYDFSIIIIFEPKYIIINNLGFDIVYKQENNSLNEEILLKKSEYQIIKYEAIDKYFRIGIYDQFSHVTNYSGYFNLDNSEDLDIKIKINPSSPYLTKDSKLFSYDGNNYFILIRIINHSYDHSTNYILLCHPLFPYLEIINLLDVPLKITEKVTGSSFIICNNKATHFPFTWENPANFQDDLIFEVYNKKEYFCFSSFNKGVLEIRERGLSLAYSISSRNKTETRSFKIEKKEIISDEELDFLHFISKARSLNSSSYKCFIKGFGISLIDQDRKEVFYTSFYNIKAKYMINIHKDNSGISNTTIINYMLLIDNFQIDYCLNDSLKIIIYPFFQLIPNNEDDVKKLLDKKGAQFIPFLSASLTTKTLNNLKTGEELTSFEQITLALQKFEVKLERDQMYNLLKIYSDFSKHFDIFSFNTKTTGQDKDKEPLLDIELPIPTQKLMKENENAFRNLINNLTFSSIRINLTLRLDTKTFDMNIPGALKRILGGFMNFGTISNCPLRFSSQKIKNVYITWNDLMWKILIPYIKQGAIQIFSILGSLDIIGNPTNLVHEIKEGVYDFVMQPGIINIDESQNIGIGTGIMRGFGGFMSGVVGGTFNSVQRFSSTVLVSIQTILDRNKREIAEIEQNEPDNILIGFYQGFIGFGAEIGKGFYNLFTDPCRRGKTEGCSGFFRGFFKGLFGLILSPIGGIFRFISTFAGGIKNSCYRIVGRKKFKTERFRYPRVIIDEEEMIHSYKENKAEAKEILFNLEKEYTDYILYAEDFICGNSYLGKKFSTAILTDKAIYVVYNSENLIFEENLKLIKSIEIHFSDNHFIVLLRAKNGKTKGFKIHKDYSNVATELFEFISALIEKIRKTSIFSRRVSGLERGKLTQKYNDDDMIDQSSYKNTIPENSYYSLKTLQSKIDND